MSKKKQRTVGFAFTGSFCTYEKIKEVVRQLVKEDNRVIPIFSQTAQTVNCRFGDARDFIIKIQEIPNSRFLFFIRKRLAYTIRNPRIRDTTILMLEIAHTI